MSELEKFVCFEGVYGRITYFVDGEECDAEGVISISDDFLVLTDKDGNGVAAFTPDGFARIEALNAE